MPHFYLIFCMIVYSNNQQIHLVTNNQLFCYQIIIIFFLIEKYSPDQRVIMKEELIINDVANQGA